MKLSSKVPAVVQATALYHLRRDVAFHAKCTNNLDHPVVGIFLSSIDTKLAQTRRKLGVRS